MTRGRVGTSRRPTGMATPTPVIVGAGLAGLATALRLAEAGVPSLVLTGSGLGVGAASGWAQGGIAAALGPQDSPELHTQDTLAAGGGLCDAEVVSAITGAAPVAVQWLAGLGADFDRHPDGSFALGLEGAHSRHRIVHATGDGSGAEIMRAVIEAVRADELVTVLEHTMVQRLALGPSGEVTGVVVSTASQSGASPEGSPRVLETSQVVLATGGAGGLWEHTTNPSGALGTGLALAARAGALLRDLEMVQFHPTALDVGLDPMPLVSEAVRGEGAVLVDEHGGRLVEDDLATRDVVARAVAAGLERAGGRRGAVRLDASQALGASFAEHFPTIAAACRTAGIDPATEPIPVRPAAHYHCGGVLVDSRGRSTVPGLWAVGEVASTGLHGANRLASNSLLEAVVCGGWVAHDVASARGQRHASPTTGTPLAPTPTAQRTTPTPEALTPGALLTTPTPEARMPGALPTTPTIDPPTGDASPAAPEPAAGPDRGLRALRALMSREVGIVRSADGLRSALADLERWAGGLDDPDSLDDATLVALLITSGALARRESRGGHLRTDRPGTARVADHTLICLTDLLPARRTA